MASLPPDEIAYQMAHIDDNWSYTLQVLCSVFTGLAVVMFGVRLFARHTTKAYLGWDDWLGFLATILLIGLNITLCLEASYGIGRHLIFVVQDPSNLTKIGKSNLAFSILYSHCMTFARLCILAFLARIFTFNYSLIRYGTYVISVLVILLYIAGMLVVLVPCQPISSWWGVPLQCHHPTWTESLAINATGSVQDFLILLLPQPIIWKLHGFNLRRKIGLSLLFMVGLFAAIVSVVRIPMLRPSARLEGKPYDSTYDSADGIAFSVIEPACVIICACMPMVPGVYRRASGATKQWLSTIYESIIRSPGGSQSGAGSSRGHTREGPHGHAGSGRDDSDSNAGSSTKMKRGKSSERHQYHPRGIVPPLPTHSKEKQAVWASRDRPFDGEYHLEQPVSVGEKNMSFGTTTEVNGDVGSFPMSRPSRRVGGDDGGPYPQPDGQPKIGSIV